MKIETSKGTSLFLRTLAGPALWTLLCGPLAFSGLSQETKTVATPAAIAPTASTTTNANDSKAGKIEPKDVTAAASRAASRVSLADVLKMVEAGVSPDVIRAFLENSSSAYDPNASDLIVLKTNGVPDSVTTAMMKRAAEIKAINETKKTESMARASAAFEAGPVAMDPESYDFWWYTHGLPRAMASSIRQNDPYPGIAPYGYGGYGGYYSPPVRYYPLRDPRFRSYSLGAGQRYPGRSR